MANQGVRTVANPSGGGQSVAIGGVELITTSAQQSGGQDTPTHSMESGAEVAQRNVVEPESGTLTGAVDSQGVPALRRLKEEKQPVTITTPEGSVPNCLVKEVTRTRRGEHVDKFGVEVEWTQVLLATVGTATVQAITQDGPKTPAGGGQSGGKSTSHVGGETKQLSNGPSANAEEGDVLGQLGDAFTTLMTGENGD